MDLVRIRRMHASYRMPRAALGERERLDRVLSDVAGDALAVALSRVGVPAHEEVCLRRLRVALRLRTDATDAALVAAWTTAIASAVRDALSGTSPDAAHYRSPSQLLLEIAAAVARDDLSRSWAWAQLGCWPAAGWCPPADAGVYAVRALTASPALTVPVVVELARMGLLPAFGERLTPAAWRALGNAVLHGAALRDDWRVNTLLAPIPSDTPGAETDEAVDVPVATSARAEAVARRALAGSVIAAAARSRHAGGDASRDAVLALIAVLETDPALVARPEEARDAARVVRRGLTPVRAARGVERPREHGAAQAGARPSDVAADALAAERRVRARSAFGGLLFLVHILEAEGLPAALLDDPALVARPLRWTLHALAAELVPVAATDPAALAFAGLRPGERSPALGQPPCTEHEARAIAGAAARIREVLAARLDWDGRGDSRPLASVCRRDAEIVADPGWIELHMLSSEVETDVRAAGLDLDPGWVPWLGAVVRFVYA